MDAVFVALADSTRRRVLELLAAEGGATATQLAGSFPVTRQAIAKHLQVLADAGLATSEDVVTGARVMAVYTALTRLDWALARVADGEGALAGKFRHPSVAPYIRSMQRQVGQVEALLSDR